MLEGDKATLEELKAVGVDLTRPVEVLHYFYVEEKDAANAIGDRIRKEGFHVEVQPAALGDNWLVLAKRTQVVSEGVIAEMRRFFEGLASDVGDAEYDGWEASVGN